MLARAVQMGSTLITIPLTLRYLGNERFGLWIAISSVLAMATFADFGVGNGVLNTVAKAFGQDDFEGVRRAISSGFAILTSIAALLMLAFFVIYPFVNWAYLFHVVSPQAKPEAGPAFAVFAICFALNISVDVVQRTQLGLQEGYRYALWQTAGSVLMLAGILAGIYFRVGLPVLVIAIAGAPVFATILNTVHFFGFVRPDLRPAWRLVSRDTISQITRLGGLFFVLQVVVGLAFSADNFIIARMLGAAQVPDYSIPQRMFAFITMLSGMFVAPLWPAYGEAISRGDISWVRHTLRKSLILTGSLTCAAALLMLLFSRELLRIWVGSSIHPSFVLLLGLTVWTVIMSCGNCLGTFLNGAEVIRFQVIVASIFGLGCVMAKVFSISNFGIASVPWAAVGSYCLLSALPVGIFIPGFLRRLSSRSPAPPESSGGPAFQEGRAIV